MAPEQCHGANHVDARADIYALGCLLYDMLCGVPPFESTGVGAVIAAHLYEDPVPPGRRTPGIPPALDALVLRLLAKLPEERPQTMVAVETMLSRALDPVAAGAEANPDAGPEVETEVENGVEVSFLWVTAQRAMEQRLPGRTS